ncbi:hypothetical protein C2845_PM09G19750 [Panicum miliaceum]|uniref:Uncharacterized protein n=1 Tax=Panicum miliaceum TaxID=4540 RepID=A0A3L6S007_PANMI|nr:hypothetical protein C2845_PM09G19750 [Panicum miliaceum]
MAAGAFGTLSIVGGWSHGGSGASAGESEDPSSGGGPWRIKSLFAGNCMDGVAVDLFHLPALRYRITRASTWMI